MDTKTLARQFGCSIEDQINVNEASLTDDQREWLGTLTEAFEKLGDEAAAYYTADQGLIGVGESYAVMAHESGKIGKLDLIEMSREDASTLVRAIEQRDIDTVVQAISAAIKDKSAMQKLIVALRACGFATSTEDTVESDEQEAYREFFKAKLKKYGVDDPSELSKENRKKFFNEIEREWTKDDRDESVVEAEITDGHPVPYSLTVGDAKNERDARQKAEKWLNKYKPGMVVTDVESGRYVYYAPANESAHGGESVVEAAKTVTFDSESDLEDARKKIGTLRRQADLSDEGNFKVEQQGPTKLVISGSEDDVNAAVSLAKGKAEDVTESYNAAVHQYGGTPDTLSETERRGFYAAVAEGVEHIEFKPSRNTLFRVMVSFDNKDQAQKLARYANRNASRGLGGAFVQKPGADELATLMFQQSVVSMNLLAPNEQHARSVIDSLLSGAGIDPNEATVNTGGDPASTVSEALDYEWLGYGLRIYDTRTGKDVLLQGDEGAKLYDELEKARTDRQVQMMLDPYTEVMESAVSEADVADAWLGIDGCLLSKATDDVNALIEQVAEGFRAEVRLDESRTDEAEKLIEQAHSDHRAIATYFDPLREAMTEAANADRYDPATATGGFRAALSAVVEDAAPGTVNEAAEVLRRRFEESLVDTEHDDEELDGILEYQRLRRPQRRQRIRARKRQTGDKRRKNRERRKKYRTQKHKIKRQRKRWERKTRSRRKRYESVAHDEIRIRQAVAGDAKATEIAETFADLAEELGTEVSVDAVGEDVTITLPTVAADVIFSYLDAEGDDTDLDDVLNEWSESLPEQGELTDSTDDDGDLALEAFCRRHGFPAPCQEALELAVESGDGGVVLAAQNRPLMVVGERSSTIHNDELEDALLKRMQQSDSITSKEMAIRIAKTNGLLKQDGRHLAMTKKGERAAKKAKSHLESVDEANRIAGMSPEDYAATWGSTDREGVYFYNFSSENQKKDRKWYEGFIRAIRNQIKKVRDNPKDYEPNDAKELEQLLRYAKDQMRQAESVDEAMSKRDLIQQFRDDILPAIQKRYEKNGRKDIPARREAWNNWLDALEKGGQITVQQAGMVLPDQFESAESLVVKMLDEIDEGIYGKGVISLLPLDVGFDLKRTGHEVSLPASAKKVMYLGSDGEEKTVEGSRNQIVKALKGVGYKITEGMDEIDGDDADDVECPACGGQRIERMGSLGKRTHYRCGNCGMQFSSTTERAKRKGKNESVLDEALEEAVRFPGENKLKRIPFATGAAPAELADILSNVEHNRGRVDKAMLRALEVIVGNLYARGTNVYNVDALRGPNHDPEFDTIAYLFINLGKNDAPTLAYNVGDRKFEVATYNELTAREDVDMTKHGHVNESELVGQAEFIANGKLNGIEEAMDRREFTKVAEILKSADITPATRKQLAQKFAEWFKGENPRFDAARFGKAAGVNLDESALDEGPGAGVEFKFGADFTTGRSRRDSPEYDESGLKIDPKTLKITGRIPVKDLTIASYYDSATVRNAGYIEDIEFTRAGEQGFKRDLNMMRSRVVTIDGMEIEGLTGIDDVTRGAGYVRAGAPSSLEVSGGLYVGVDATVRYRHSGRTGKSGESFSVAFAGEFVPSKELKDAYNNLDSTEEGAIDEYYGERTYPNLRAVASIYGTDEAYGGTGGEAGFTKPEGGYDWYAWDNDKGGYVFVGSSDGIGENVTTFNVHEAAEVVFPASRLDEFCQRIDEVGFPQGAVQIEEDKDGVKATVNRHVAECLLPAFTGNGVEYRDAQ